MKRIIFIIIGLIAIIAIGLLIYFKPFKKESAKVTIGRYEFRTELAKTAQEREKGLSNRTELDVNSGMLFVFENPDVHSFWMKNTLIPLDIIWINEGKIVEMVTLDPDGYDETPSYTPSEKAQYVLEINGGLKDEYGFLVGDEVKISY